MADRRATRIAALADSLALSGLDAILLTSAPNIRYLTGFSGSSALLIVTTRRDVVLITDFRYKTQAADESGDLARVVVEPQSLWTGLWQQLPSLTYVEVVGLRVRASGAPRFSAAAGSRSAVAVAAHSRRRGIAPRTKGS